MSNNLILETKRCILRKVTLEDTDYIYDYYKEPVVVKYLPFNHHKSKLDSKRFIKKFFIKKYKNEEEGHYGVVLKENNILIGNAGFNNISKDKKVGEIGICINPKYWGGDLSTEISGEIIRYGFEVLKLEKIIANTYDKNNYSRKSLEILGFKYLGIHKERFKNNNLSVSCHKYEYMASDYKR